MAAVSVTANAVFAKKILAACGGLAAACAPPGAYPASELSSRQLASESETQRVPETRGAQRPEAQQLGEHNPKTDDVKPVVPVVPEAEGAPHPRLIAVVGAAADHATALFMTISHHSQTLPAMSSRP